MASKPICRQCAQASRSPFFMAGFSSEDLGQCGNSVTVTGVTGRGSGQRGEGLGKDRHLQETREQPRHKHDYLGANKAQQKSLVPLAFSRVSFVISFFAKMFERSMMSAAHFCCHAFKKNFKFRNLIFFSCRFSEEKQIVITPTASF